MSIISNIASIDRKFAWSFFGFVLAVFFGGLTLYNEFVKDPNPALSIQILSDTNVLDVRENIPELKIVYGDVDIKSLGQTLSVVVFKVQNLGGAPILGTYYESNAVPRLNLRSGKYIKVEQVGATNDYLAGFAKPALIDQSTLQLPQVILEPNESYTIKALLLHGPRSDLPFKATGKVAGVKSISVVPVESAERKESFWATVVSGSIPTQLARAPVYFFGFLLLLALVIAPLVFVTERIEAFRRGRTVKQFKKHYQDEISDVEARVLSAYQKHGLGPLVRAKELVGDEGKLRRSLEYAKRRPSRRRPEQVERAIIDFEDSATGPIHVMLPIETLHELALVSTAEDGTSTVNKDIEKFLGKFIDFVNIKRS